MCTNTISDKIEFASKKRGMCMERKSKTLFYTVRRTDDLKPVILETPHKYCLKNDLGLPRDTLSFSATIDYSCFVIY